MTIRFLLALLILPMTGAWAAHVDFGKYAYDPSGRVLDFGVQPLALPAAMVTETMKRDLVLRAHLTQRRMAMRQHSYEKAADMRGYLRDGRLDAAVVGDMTALVAAAEGDIHIVALLKQAFSPVIARQYLPPAELRGKRIGYVPDSAPHGALLVTLDAAGLSERDVTLVPSRLDELPEALRRGSIDAFAAYEPAPTIALARVPGSTVVAKGLSNAYLVLGRRFLETYPEDAKHFIAAYVRAVYWLQQQRGNVEKAAQWALAAAEAFSGRPPQLNATQAAAITRRELLDVPSAPMLPRHEETAHGHLYRQFEFLKRAGRIERNTAWTKVAGSIDRTLLDDVLGFPTYYGLQLYLYEH